MQQILCVICKHVAKKCYKASALLTFKFLFAILKGMLSNLWLTNYLGHVLCPAVLYECTGLRQDSNILLIIHIWLEILVRN